MVDVNSESFDVLATDRREILDPEIGIGELSDFLRFESLLSHDLMLKFVLTFRQLRRVAIGVDLILYLFGRSSDRHAFDS